MKTIYSIISNKFAIFKEIRMAKSLIIVKIFWGVASLSILFIIINLSPIKHPY